METINENTIYTKSNVEFHEYNMHNYIRNLDIVSVPKIINYNKQTKTMQMEKIQGMSVSDFYGEDFSAVPDNVIAQIRNIIQDLKSHNIIYPDITGYNFIEFNNMVWIIDFEHAYFGFIPTQSDPFVDEFLDGNNTTWNPEFA
jgi:tRNA A-37 threonylcarbamoyl transferase component Bud32